MEKLIDLLNEYNECLGWVESYNEATWMFITNVWQLIDETEIISKKFWFIQWLVDNDKIDFYEWKYLENPIWSNNYDECDYLELIQWLAISDTPIEDLISYLK